MDSQLNEFINQLQFHVLRLEHLDHLKDASVISRHAATFIESKGIQQQDEIQYSYNYFIQVIIRQLIEENNHISALDCVDVFAKSRGFGFYVDYYYVICFLALGEYEKSRPKLISMFEDSENFPLSLLIE